MGSRGSPREASREPASSALRFADRPSVSGRTPRVTRSRHGRRRSRKRGDPGCSSRLLIGQSSAATASWKYARYPVGLTALAVLALKHSGLPNDHPAIEGAVRLPTSSRSSRLTTSTARGWSPARSSWQDSHASTASAGSCRRSGFAPVSAQGRDRWTWSYKTQNNRAAVQQRRRNSNTAKSPDPDRPRRVLRATPTRSSPILDGVRKAALQRCGVKVDEGTKQERQGQHWEAGAPARGFPVGCGVRRTLASPDVASTPSMTCAGIASMHLLGRSGWRSPGSPLRPSTSPTRIMNHAASPSLSEPS